MPDIELPIQLRVRTSGTETPPATLLPGEPAIYAGDGFIRMWVGDAAGTPRPYGEDAGGFVKKTGDTMSGALALPGAPTAAAHAARKDYVDTQVATRLTQAQGDARYLQLSGGTLTGKLTLDGAPTADLHAATKGYVDTRLTNYSTTAQADNAYVAKSGSTMTGALTLPSSNPTATNHATRKAYVDAQVATRLTQAQGDARYAALSHSHTESQITDLDRMRWRGAWAAGTYAQNDVVSYQGGVFVASGQTVATPPAGNWRQIGSQGANVTTSDTAPASPQAGDLWFKTSAPIGLYLWYVDTDSSQWVSTDQASILANGFVQKAGDSMSGQLALNAGDPTVAAHATRKAYVDAQIDTRQPIASDERLKKNIIASDPELDLATVLQLSSRVFEWRDPGADRLRRRGPVHGLIAQEVMQVAPDAVFEGQTLGIDVLNLLSRVVGAVQALEARVSTLQGGA